MNPIDVTGLPRSLEVAKAASVQGRQGELQVQSQSRVFVREMDERSQAVNETPETGGRKIQSDSGSQERSSWQEGSGKGKGNEKGQEQAAKTDHPAKGKILDIRGA